VSEAAPKLVPYRVEVSGRVSAEVKALHARITDPRGRLELINALLTIDHVLRIYPQFGEPLRNLTTIGQTLYAAVFPPLFVEYVIDEPNRTVYIGMPFKHLPKSGLK
jgi:hypothetical protein